MPSFDEEYGKLNASQKQAVDTIEGPVMVIAGPGTGKTQVVSMRVANILRKTQMRPSNILCLTFSVSGATAMRDRLRLLIGPDAYAVTVRTIHGFAQDIISEHPVLFDEWSLRDQITDLERYRSMNTIIDQFLPDIALVNPKHPYGRTRDILERISLVKREGKSQEDLNKAADAYDVQMEGKSKPGTKIHERNLLQARKFREFTQIFEAYQKMLRETGRYDYDDMILYVIRALEREEWLLMGLQERYQYILVDEFQDTNGAQYRFLELLTTYAALPHDLNFFVVGDDDQAIYRFQGANLQNILSFKTRFPQAAVVVLTESYRSTQAILDTARSLIAHNTERLVGRIEGLTKDLHAASKKAGELPILLRAPSDMAEPWMVTDMVEERLKAGIPPEEIAILTQTNGELRTYYDVLFARGIPVTMTGKSDLLSHPHVLELIAILRCLPRIEDNARMAAALSIDCFGCHPADLARMYRHSRENKVKLIDILLSLDTPSPQIPLDQFRKLDRVLHGRDFLLDLSQRLASRTVLDTVERSMHGCGILHPENGTMHPLDLAAIQEFFDRVKQRTFEQPGFTFENLLSDLDFYSNPDYGQLRLTYALPHLVAQGIQLMTAHQSKGKEFRTVILVNFREGHWDKRRNPASLSLPEDLLFGWEKEQKAFEQHQDERRIAFVAITRAKEELILTCPLELTTGERAKAVSPSAFFAEAGALPESERELLDPGKASTLLLKGTRSIDADLRGFLEDRLKTFALSASGINRFLESPQKFLEIDLLQVPQLSDYAHAYGNAVHWALRQWALRMQRGTPMGKEEFIGEFQNFLTHREFLADTELRQLLHVGQEALPRYYDERLQGSTPTVYKVEDVFTARVGDIPIKGQIDRIDLDHPDSAIATVIDFKTGRPQTESQIRSGDYFRQLQFYAVLLHYGRSILQPKAFILEFIGEREEHPVSRVFQMSEADRTEMEKLITAIWAKITALDFTPL